MQVILHGEKLWLLPQWRSFDPNYETAAVTSFLSRIEPGNVVWDIGSHIGLYSLLAARRLGPRGRIVAWEPAPESFRQMQAHLSLNGLAATSRAIPEAVYDGEYAVLNFELEESDPTNVYNRIGYDAPDKPAGSTIQVGARSLDAWIETLGGPPDVVKMDVEGAEVAALRGGRRVFSGELGKKPKVLLSVHPAEMRQYGTAARDLQDILDAYGYDARTLEGAPADLSAFGEVWLLPR